MLFTKFFVTSGKGVSKTSSLNAFDKALVEARIDQCNLVPVSSILPQNATPVDYARIPAGSITFCVLARQDGRQGQSIGAGVAWAMCEGLEIKERFGIVAEEHARHGNEEKIKKSLLKKLAEMASARNMKIIEHKTEAVTLKKIPSKNHGTVVAALVYTN
ncbi:MAG: pyruvoyl-dependent arginine decarboxylase [Candidatus Altiarchaeota archaeon]